MPLGQGLGAAQLQRRDLALGEVGALLPFRLLGRDGFEPARAELRLARQRLGFAARLGERRAFVRHLAAYLRELGFEPGRRRQGGERLGHVARGGDRLVTARGQANVGFRQRREPDGDAARFALRRGVTVARLIGIGLRLAPARACVPLGRHRGIELGLRALDRAALCADFGARRGEVALEIAEPVALRQPPRRRRLRVRRRRKAVPAP